MRPIMLGIASAFFFAFTFVLNKAMEMNGGSWVWSASLRYFFMVPFLVIIVLIRGNLKPILLELRNNALKWILWSSVGFGIFYSFICFASAYGPGWLIAGTWQLTIISGTLLAPLFMEQIAASDGTIVHARRKIPIKSLGFSLLIIVGIVFMQVEFARSLSLSQALLCLISILIASFAYPLGNRKMMEVAGGRFDVFQRVLGMTIASLPFWLILSVYGWMTAGLPSVMQVYQSGIVALFSGVVATILFFAATDLAKDNMQKLGAVEATQSFEVLFALIGEMVFLSAGLPSPVSLLGIGIVIIGMVLHSIFSRNIKKLKLAKEAHHFN
ncbi:multidrug resistance efflux transporter family protein [Niallia sp. MER 6]|uniref:DMT family transporter n=1 Tax=Niallia sp. MER 6 TaxID=2939567 RepID=UPI00203AB3E8|nr:multidrug resistance efflux transporter family protein [Niallia sp. MER 6]MCM3030823.1 multidrug resistance efflux transporter family protein [Niallia sp. MER 6]